MEIVKHISTAVPSYYTLYHMCNDAHIPVFRIVYNSTDNIYFCEYCKEEVKDPFWLMYIKTSNKRLGIPALRETVEIRSVYIKE